MDNFPPPLDQFNGYRMPSPDWGLSTDLSTDIEEIKLGDGYVVRQPKGLNFRSESFSPSWSDLDPAPGQFIYDWLKARADLVPFRWVHPVTGAVYQVIARGPKISYDTWNNAVVSVTFEQDFNPVG